MAWALVILAGIIETGWALGLRQAVARPLAYSVFQAGSQSRRVFEGVCPSIEKAQQRVRASPEDPKGVAWSAHLLRLASRKGNHPARRGKPQQLHTSGHAEHARRFFRGSSTGSLRKNEHPSFA
jgi:hypothetical protein